MKRPMARPTAGISDTVDEARVPRAYAPQVAVSFEQSVEPIVDALPDDSLATPPPKALGWLGRVLWITASALISLALGLAAERLIADLFATTPWLGWLGLGILAVFVAALLALLIRESLALARLRSLDRLKTRAAAVLVSDRAADGKAVLAELQGIYAGRTWRAAAKPWKSQAKSSTAARSSALPNAA